MDYYRRVSTGQQQHIQQDAVPPAPPLPPPKRSSDIAPRSGLLDRFQGILGGARRSVTGQQAEAAQALRNHLSYAQRYGHSKSRSSSHRTGLKIRAIDVNHARTHAVLAGGKILKTVRVDGSNCVEDFNIRSAAVNYAWEATAQDGKKSHRASEDVSAVQRETFDIEDVAWSNGPNFSSYIATAASNGRIMLYDLERPVVEIGRLHEHNRQVHKVDFNPTEGRFLLSGSQDGTVRLWDLRTLQRNVMICYSRETFPGRSDGVRHTKWSPTDTWTFAMCTDNGTVQRWDTRQNKAPVLKLSSHSETCNSIDWHPDGRHLVSASKDQNVKVWDMNADRRQKPSYQIRAPREVQNVRWRPPCFIPDGPDSYLKQTTHLATSYKTFPIVHVWDLRRPFMPFREIDHGINSGTTDMLWQSKDLLWTVGPEGEFCQTDVHFAHMTLNRRPPRSLAYSATGELVFSTQPSEPLRSTSDDPTDEFAADESRVPSSTSPQKRAGRLAISDDSFEERFLSTSFRKWHSRTPSIKSSRSLVSTPPSAEDIAKPVTMLDDAMRDFHDVAPHQATFSGPYLGSIPRNTFTYLTQKYQRAMHQQTVAHSDSFASICLSHAKALSKSGRTSEAYVWKLVAHDISLWLRSHNEASHAHESDWHPVRKSLFHPSLLGNPASARRIASHNSLATEKASGKEQSTSKVATPLAQPVKPSEPNGSSYREDHTDVETMEPLPPSQSSSQLNGGTGKPQNGWKPSNSAAERRQDMLLQLRAHPRAVIDFDSYPQSQSRASNIQPPLFRHDSGESFMMFSTSSESRTRLAKHDSFSSSAAASVNRTQHSWNGSDSATQRSIQRSDSGEDAPFFQASFDLERADQGASGIPLGNGVDNISSKPDKSPHTSSVADRGDDAPTNAIAVSIPTSDEIALVDGSPLHKAHPNDTSSVSMPLERSGIVESTILAEPSHSSFSLDEDTWLKVDLFCKLLERYASSADAQLATQIFMLCSPVLVPSASQLQPPDPDLIIHHPILGSIYSHLTNSTNFAPPAAQKIVAETHLVLEELGISSAMVETFLTTYHEQLLSHRLFSAAASLRQSAYPAFPAVYEQSFQSIDTGLLCTYCNNPLNNPVDKTICETCKKAQAPCAVCLLPESPYTLPLVAPLGKKGKGSRKPSFVAAAAGPSLTPTPLSPSPLPQPDAGTEQHSSQTTANADSADAAEAQAQKTRLFTTCALCNHSLHTPCAYTWFADPIGGGACPVEYCVCDCVPGTYRDEKLAGARLQMEIRRGLARSGSSTSSAAGTPTHSLATGTPPSGGLPSLSIRRDDWDIGQSQAVRGVRGALRDGGMVSQASDTEGERSGAGTPLRQGGRRGGLGMRSGSSRGNSEAGLEAYSIGSSGGSSGIAGSAGTRRVRVVGPGE